VYVSVRMMQMSGIQGLPNPKKGSTTYTEILASDWSNLKRIEFGHRSLARDMSAREHVPLKDDRIWSQGF